MWVFEYRNAFVWVWDFAPSPMTFPIYRNSWILKTLGIKDLVDLGLLFQVSISHVPHWIAHPWGQRSHLFCPGKQKLCDRCLLSWIAITQNKFSGTKVSSSQQPSPRNVLGSGSCSFILWRVPLCPRSKNRLPKPSGTESVGALACIPPSEAGKKPGKVWDEDRTAELPSPQSKGMAAVRAAAKEKTTVGCCDKGELFPSSCHLAWVPSALRHLG